MSRASVYVHELIAWGLDEYSYRNNSVISLEPEKLAKRLERAQQKLVKRDGYESCNALLAEETERIRPFLTAASQCTDLQKEYEGRDWTLGVVDLRSLLAFQRRLVFSPMPLSQIPEQSDWPQLISLTLGSRRSTEHHFARNANAKVGLDINLYSNNPDLQLRFATTAGHDGLSTFSLYGGSPFFEVAEFRGRWFLRDGYHRAYRLLQAGVDQLPAVVLRTRTLAELGATETWFFGEDQLLSNRPPRVTDFLDESLVLRYERTALRKVIRVRIEESLEPFEETNEIQGEKI